MEPSRPALQVERTKSPYDRFLTEVSKRRNPVFLRQMHLLSMRLPVEPVNLVGGLANPETFPFTDASFTLADGGVVTITPQKMVTALQYQAGKGYEPLLTHLKAFTRDLHQPPTWDQKDVVMTTGATEGFGQAVEVVLEEGDGVIVPEFIYSAMLSVLLPLKPNILSIPCDEYGFKIEELRTRLENYQGKKIKLLCVVSTGSNPTGTSLPEDRRREIYKLACQYDFLILEDDPYYFLRFDGKAAPPSFLALDTDSRVIRMDTFSKVLGPGLRVGWLTAARPLMESIHAQIQCTSNHPSMLSQVLVHETLLRWGTEGFNKHVQKISSFYQSRRDAMLAAARKHLKDIAQWVAPDAGMFLWLKFVKVKDASSLLLHDAMQDGVMLCPGNAFSIEPQEPTPYFRVSFSWLTPDKFDEGFSILANTIKKLEED